MPSKSIYCSCIYCKKEFSTKGLHTHFERKHGTQTQKSKYSNGNNGKYKELSHKARLRYDNNPKFCKNCNNKIPYEIKQNIFCSKSCSTIFNNTGKKQTEYQKQIARTTIEKTNKKLGKETRKQIIKNCEFCNEEFITYSSAKKKFCSSKCSARKRSIDTQKYRTELSEYRLRCKFKFNLNDYPDEFDFNLISKYGWYKAKNKGNNLNGVSRDHMVSIRYGFDNNISPEIIAHPANCQLLQHNNNVSKGLSCSISIEILLEKIKLWDLKYNA